MPVPKLRFATTFFSSSYTIREWQDGAVTTDDHMRRVTVGTTTDRPIQAHAYASTSRELMFAEKKGMETSGRITIHTSEVLELKTPQNQRRGTIFVFDGQEYEIDWRDPRYAGASEHDRSTYMARLVSLGGTQ